MIYQCPKTLKIVISLFQNDFNVSKQFLGDEACKRLDWHEELDREHFLTDLSSVRSSGCAVQADGAENT